MSANSFLKSLAIIAGIGLQGALLLAVTALPANAQKGGGGGASQNVNFSDPASEKVVNGLGVDMRSLQYQYNETDIAMGGLSLSRVTESHVRFDESRPNPFGNFGHNWDIYIYEHQKTIGHYENRQTIVQPIQPQITGSRATVQFGLQREQFNGRHPSSGNEGLPGTQGENYIGIAKGTFTGRMRYSGVYPLNSGGDNTVFTWTSSTGTEVTFRPLGSQDCTTSGGIIERRCAYASQVIEPSGIRYNLSYDNDTGGENQTRLRRVDSTQGYSLIFEYGTGGQVNLVTKACIVNLAYTTLSGYTCPANAEQTATYTYTNFASRSRLASVTGPDQATQSFGYAYRSNVPALLGNGTDPDAFEMRFTRPGETVPWQVQVRSPWQNSDGGKDEVVRRQEFADGTYVDYAAHFPWGQPDVAIAIIQGSTSTNNEGHQVKVEYAVKRYPAWFAEIPGQPWTKSDIINQTSPHPTRFVDELGRVTTYDFCIDHTPPAGYYPVHGTCEMIPTSLSHNAPGLATFFTDRNPLTGQVLEQTQAGIVQEAAWMPCVPRILCGKPEYFIDGEGNRTDWTYDSTHGGVLTHTLPADESGVRPQTRYAYAQQYAWYRNSSGATTQAATPIWVLVSEEYCRTSAADANGNCAAGALDEVVTTYEYQAGSSSNPSNLLVVGTAVTAANEQGVLETLRTCTTYDENNRAIATTPPSGTTSLSSCQ